MCFSAGVHALGKIFRLTIVVITPILHDVITGLQRELKQGKPFGSRDEELYLNILRTAEQLSCSVAETLKQADLMPTQHNALRILRGAGQVGASCCEVGERW